MVPQVLGEVGRNCVVVRLYPLNVPAMKCYDVMAKVKAKLICASVVHIRVSRVMPSLSMDQLDSRFVVVRIKTAHPHQVSVFVRCIDRPDIRLAIAETHCICHACPDLQSTQVADQAQ